MPVLLGAFGAVLVAAAFTLLIEASRGNGIGLWVASWVCLASGLMLFGGAYFRLRKEEKEQEQERKDREKREEEREERDIARFEEEKKHWETIYPGPSINKSPENKDDQP